VSGGVASSPDPRPRPPSHRIKLAASLALSGILLALALRQVNLAELGQLVRGANYAWVGVGVGVYFVDIFLRSARWQVLLAQTRSISVRRLYPILAIGYMANNLLPGRVGELSRAYLVGRRERVSASTVLASVIVERLIDGLTVLLLLLGALAVLPDARAPASWVMLLARIAAITFGLAVVGSVALAVAPRFWLRQVGRIAHLLPERAGHLTLRAVDHFIAGFGVLGDPALLARTALLSVAIWVVGAATYLFVAAAFDVRLPLVAAVATICVVNLATAVPQAPAGLGAFEAAAEGMLILLGVESTTAFGITVVLHAVLFFPVVLVGLAFLWKADLSLGSLWSGGRREAPSPVEATR
jgi:uncharacterized protein (TIRG00374 family)